MIYCLNPLCGKPLMFDKIRTLDCRLCWECEKRSRKFINEFRLEANREKYRRIAWKEMKEKCLAGIIRLPSSEKLETLLREWPVCE